jgi:hypothetical protein
MTAPAAWAELSSRLRAELPEPAFFSFFASGLGVSIDEDGALTVALANDFCVSQARRITAPLGELLTGSSIAAVEFVSRGALGLPEADGERADPIVEAQAAQAQHERQAHAERAVERQREHPPGVITRLLAERGFWSLDPAMQLTLFEVDDLHGALQVVPSAYGMPGTYEASVFTGLLTLWAGGDREEPRVETSLHRLAELLRLSWSGRTSTQLVEAIERLKATSYRVVVQNDAGGWTDLFSLLDRVQTRWNGPPSSPARHISAVFSAPIWEAITQPRQLRPVDLDVLHGLGKNRDLAKRLFLYAEGIPMHRLPSGDELLERVIDERLAATLGGKPQLYDLRRNLERAGQAIVSAAPRYRSIEAVPRTKRGLRRGEPTHLLRIVRARVAPTR